MPKTTIHAPQPLAQRQHQPVHLGWAADYTPSRAPAAREILASSRAKSLAGGTAGVKELIASESRHGHGLLHLPPSTRDFTDRTELVAARPSPGTTGSK